MHLFPFVSRPTRSGVLTQLRKFRQLLFQVIAHGYKRSIQKRADANSNLDRLERSKRVLLLRPQKGREILNPTRRGVFGDFALWLRHEFGRKTPPSQAQRAGSNPFDHVPSLSGGRASPYYYGRTASGPNYPRNFHAHSRNPLYLQRPLSPGQVAGEISGTLAPNRPCKYPNFDRGNLYPVLGIPIR